MAVPYEKNDNPNLIQYASMMYDMTTESLPEEVLNHPETMSVESLVKYVKWLQRQHIVLGDKWVSMDIQLSFLKTKNENLKEEYNKLKKDSEVLKKENEELVMNNVTSGNWKTFAIDCLNQDIRNLKKESEDLKKENEKLKEKVSELEIKIHVEHTTLDGFSKRVKSLTEQVSELEGMLLTKLLTINALAKREKALTDLLMKINHMAAEGAAPHGLLL